MSGDIRRYEGIEPLSSEVAEICCDFWGGSSYRGPMSRSEQKQAHQPRWWVRTKDGEKVTAELTEALASEAEQGYDLSQAKRHRLEELAPEVQGSAEARLD